ncbi:MAG TPA: recombinase RecF [Porphyromonadaceae bacterium]|nr:recombinase RecF [Porphyromonadaceae bacterium]
MIKRIELSNYKSIKSASINLRTLNILLGANGAGKSNFISFFELTRHLLEQRLGAYMLAHGGIDSMLYRGRKISESITALIEFDNGNSFGFRLKPSAGPKAYIEYTRGIIAAPSPNEQSAEKRQMQVWDSDTEESAIMTSQDETSEFIRSFMRSLTVYHFHDTSETSPMRRPSRVGDNELLRHDGANIAAYLYRLRISDERTFNIIESTIRSIAPYFKCFKLTPDKDMDGYISLEWEERDSDIYLNASDFSDGTLRFIALATLLLQPSPPQAIIIDEPELGLHPAAINKLAALVKRASFKSQIIVATQSVSVVDCFSPEDIIVVDRKDGQSAFDRLDNTNTSPLLAFTGAVTNDNN